MTDGWLKSPEISEFTSHHKVMKRFTLSAKPGDDAKQYQLRAVRSAIEETQK